MSDPNLNVNWDATPYFWDTYPYFWEETPASSKGWRGNPTNKIPNPIQKDVNRSEGRIVDNRALHVRRDTDVQKNFTVTIKDIDETVFGHLNKMQLTVVDVGNNIKVPITYASPEKWKSVRKDGFMRDNNGRIILPALVFYRTNIESDPDMTTFNKYLRYSVIKTYSQKNQYTKFSSLMGHNTPIHEVYNVVMPDHMIFNYKFIIWTEYVEQMNSLIERINFETNDYWGTERGLRFRTSVNSYINTTEVENDKDRLVKTEFDLVLKGYLLPDTFAPGLDGFKPTTEKVFTRKKIVFGMEVVSTSWKPTVDPSISDRWRSQKFPNIVAGKEPTPAPISFKDSNVEKNVSPSPPITSSVIKWRSVPNALTDYGEEGWKSYNSDYYYYYTGGLWHRIPINLFNDVDPNFIPIEGEDGYDSDYYYIYVIGVWKRTPITTFNTFY